MRSGCLVLVADFGTWVLLWPDSYSLLDMAASGISRNRGKNVVPSVGDEVEVGGAERGDEDATHWAADITDGTLPLKCWAALYWLVTSIR